MFYNQAKKEALRRLKQEEGTYNGYVRKAQDLAVNLYEVRKSSVQAISRVEEYINAMANTPKEFQKDIADTVINIQEFKEAVHIEKQNSSNNKNCALLAALGTVVGGAFIAYGASATKGGGKVGLNDGKKEENVFLKLSEPIGWVVAALVLVGAGAFASYGNKKTAEDACRLTKDFASKNSEIKQIVEKLEWLLKSTKELKTGLGLAEFNLFPKDYLKFSDEQKLRLGSLVNNAKALGKLINERVN